MPEPWADGATMRSETGILRVVTAGDAVVTGLSMGKRRRCRDGWRNHPWPRSQHRRQRSRRWRHAARRDCRHGNASPVAARAHKRVGADNPLDVDVRRLDASARDAIQITARSSVDVGAVEAGLEVDWRLPVP